MLALLLHIVVTLGIALPLAVGLAFIQRTGGDDGDF